MTGSVSFERAAAFYDRTRITDTVELAAAIDALDIALPPGPLLEIGVGTGALAVPLVARGRTLTGLDLSRSMLERLRDKDPEHRVRLSIADATRPPFKDRSFAGAYCRWVLHLVADWRTAVRELCRVASGPVVVEPGGYGGEWRILYLRFVDELGEVAAPIGLDLRNGNADLDEAFAAQGALLRDVVETPGTLDASLSTFFEETAAKTYSWTWRVPQSDLDRAVATVRAWAIGRYGGDLDRPFEREAPHRWRIYDRA